MSASEGIESRLRRVVMAQLGAKRADVVRDAKFGFDLGMDSLDAIELLMAIEDEFGIEVPDEKAEKITTFGEALDALIAALGEGKNG